MNTTPDAQLRFLLPAAGVRGVAVHLGETWRSIAARADYPPAAAELLGEACAAAALFTGHAKVDGRLSVQLRSAGAHAAPCSPSAPPPAPCAASSA